MQVAEPLTHWTLDQEVKTWLLHRDACHQGACGCPGPPVRLLEWLLYFLFILDVFEIHKNSITGHIFLCLVILCGICEIHPHYY